ncbi:MAG: hypothetical protein KUG77_09250 [Nannocystaceae bacterium]|nr:hypothetical protein [Nannocystaceae bacterium]
MRAAWCALLLVCVACDGGSSGEDTAAGTSTGSVTGSNSSSSSTGGESSSSTGEPGPVYAPEFPTCRRECNFAADCCPAGLDPCPSNEFPANFGCAGGLCVPAPCENDAQCESLTAGSTCHDVDGVPQCVVTCQDDDACAAQGTGFACGGETTDGQGYCRERCDVGQPCLLDSCNPDGVCVCESDDHCINGFACDAEAGS